MNRAFIFGILLFALLASPAFAHTHQDCDIPIARSAIHVEQNHDSHARFEPSGIEEIPSAGRFAMDANCPHHSDGYGCQSMLLAAHCNLHECCYSQPLSGGLEWRQGGNPDSAILFRLADLTMTELRGFAPLSDGKPVLKNHKPDPRPPAF